MKSTGLIGITYKSIIVNITIYDCTAKSMYLMNQGQDSRTRNQCILLLIEMFCYRC